MKKTKGILTSIERKVLKNRKTIAILTLVLLVSITVNVIYITGINEKIFSGRPVKDGETAEGSRNTADDKKKNFNSKDFFRSLYDSDDEELYIALEEAYNIEPAQKHVLDGVDNITIRYDKAEYSISLSQDICEFSNGRKTCKFTRERVEELTELLRDAELKEVKFSSYATSSGKVLDAPAIKRCIKTGPFVRKTYYPLEDMSEILECCMELEEVMIED